MITLTAIVLALFAGWAIIKAWNRAAAVVSPEVPATPAPLEQGSH